MKRHLATRDSADGTTTVFDKNAASHTLAALNKLRLHRNLCDVILKVEEGEVFAHRNILMVNSEYFRAMFATGFDEMRSREVDLSHGVVDRHSAEALVSFMYTGHFTVTADTVQGLIMAADHWQMTEPKRQCAEFMERHIDTQNCLGVLSVAEAYCCNQLCEKCLQLIRQQFFVVADTDDFLHLSAAKLQEIISIPDLTLGHEGEDVVLRAVMRWVEHNPGERAAHLTTVLPSVRLSCTTRECRERCLDSSQLVQESQEIQGLIEDLIQKPSEVRKSQTTLYVIGGFLQSRTGPKCPRLRSVECLDKAGSQWLPCADFPLLSSASVALNLCGHLLCVAIEPVKTDSEFAVAIETRVFQYSPIRRQWLDGRSSFSPKCLEHVSNCLRREGAVAVCDRTSAIYVVSNLEVVKLQGRLVDGEVVCDTAEVLPQPLDFFSEQHRSHSALVAQGCLYALGGDRHDMGMDLVPTAAVAVLGRGEGSWKRCANMLKPRARLAATELNGYIYVCGGFNLRRLTSAERYDPDTDTWTFLQPMAKFRSHHRALALDGKIWVMGGKSYAFNNGGARKVLSVCEVYDPETDTWTEGPTMKFARCGFAAVTI